MPKSAGTRRPPPGAPPSPSAASSLSTPPVRAATQVRIRPPSGYLPDIKSLPRTSDGAILVNYVGPYAPASLQVFLELRSDVRYLRYSRNADDQMRLVAEIAPNADFHRFQRLLGAVRGLGQAGRLRSAGEPPST